MPYKLVTLNVDSIVHSSRRTLLSDFLSETGADVLFLQETKADRDVRVNFSGYNVFRCDIRRGWGGSALLVRDNIPVRGAFCVNDPVHAVFVQCYVGGEWVRFASCYVPHGIVDPRSAFLTLLRGHPGAIFGGDFNSRNRAFGDASDNCYGLALDEVVTTLGVHLINPPAPTCYHATDGSFIDKFLLCGLNLPYFELAVLPSFSDHCAFSISLPGSPPLPIPNECRRMFHLMNRSGINRSVLNDLRGLDIPNTTSLANGDCEFLAGSIGESLSRAVQRHVPLNPLNTHKIILSPAVRALQRHAKSLQRKLHRSRGLLSEADRGRISSELAMTKRMISGHVNSETARFFSNTFDSVGTRRDAYQVVRRFTGYKRRPVMGGSLFVDDDKVQMISGAPGIAEALSDQFSGNHGLTHGWRSPLDQEYATIAQGVREDSTQIPIGPLVRTDIGNRAQLLAIEGSLPPDQRGILVSADEVAEIINRKPNKKSSGVDGVPYPVLKSLGPDVLLQLTSFF